MLRLTVHSFGYMGQLQCRYPLKSEEQYEKGQASQSSGEQGSHTSNPGVHCGQCESGLGTGWKLPYQAFHSQAFTKAADSEFTDTKCD